MSDRTFSTPLIAALLAAALPGCDREPEAQPAAAAANAVPPAAPGPAPAANAAAPAPAGGCIGALAVELDSASFARDDAAPFAPARLETFRQAAATAFREAAEAACAAGDVDPARLGSLRRLVVQSASGADSTAIYDDAERFGPGTLIFQYVFVEADLALPDSADIAEGLGCWAAPDRPVCAERLP